LHKIAYNFLKFSGEASRRRSRLRRSVRGFTPLPPPPFPKFLDPPLYISWYSLSLAIGELLKTAEYLSIRQNDVWCIQQLLMKPADHGLAKKVGVKGEQNLRLLATIFTYLLRKVYTTLQQPQTGSLVGLLNADCWSNVNKIKMNYNFIDFFRAQEQ